MTTFAETTLELDTAPTVEPISTAEATTHMRVDDAPEDTLIGDYIKAARLWVEGFTNRQLITATWKVHMPEFPDEVRVPLPPIQSVTAVTYIDANGDAQTFSSASYQTNLLTQPALIKPIVDGEWPEIRGGDYNSVTVEFVAGYGDAGSDVPQDIRTAIRQLVAHMHEHREVVVIGAKPETVPMTVQTLLWPYRVEVFG